MKLQIWAEVPLDNDDDETAHDWVLTLQDEYPSLAGLVADLIDGNKAKVIVSVDGRRVVLAMHEEIICPQCRQEMIKTEIGEYLFVCACGHQEGRTMI